MFKLISKLFGTRSERALKELYHYVDTINAAYEELKLLSNEALREKTQTIIVRIQDELQPIQTQVLAKKETSGRRRRYPKKRILFSRSR